MKKVDSQKDFVRLVAGKTLTRPFVNLEVAKNGIITGKGAAWAISGDWSWQDGYFCRDLFWGGDALGYNCQEIKVEADRVRFTSDRGAGDSAEFKIN
jgi:hypothetical protein